MYRIRKGLEQPLRKILTWLPSLIITLFYIPNALDKLLNSNQTDKIVANSNIMIATGVFLLISTALFLYRKTMLIGTFLLALYMTIIVFIHMYKGKPYEVTILIVIATIMTTYIRNPQSFHHKTSSQTNKSLLGRIKLLKTLRK
ncbi:hypothetical protein [Mangrovimonas sp. ST2L15]|uniref:hypothetical protein n=1 Tax=Mangrovimonas sp. ST2L15 TaxID=1645916 RepID=UPI000A429F9B|nr:hypothetical protein [Mangrovimonas sp. ST2L15]